MRSYASKTNSGSYSQPSSIWVTKRPFSRARTLGLNLFLFLQPIHIFVLAFFFYPMQTETLFFSGAISLVVYSFLIYGEYIRDRFAISPFLLYLFLSWIRLGLIPIYVAFAVELGYQNDLLFGGYDAFDYFVPGHFINVFGDWFLVAGYYILRKCSSPPKPLQFYDPRTSTHSMVKSAFILLAITYGAKLAIWFEFPLERLGQVYNFVSAYGAAAAMLILLFAIGKASTKKRHFLILLFAAVFIFELQHSLSSYMKTDAIVCVLPVLIYLVINLPNIHKRFGPRISYKHMLVIAAISLFFLSVLFTYSNMRRGVFWQMKGVLMAERPDVIPFLLPAIKASIPGTQEFSENQVFPRGGVWHFLARNEFVSSSGWAYSYVQQYGTNDGKYIREVPANLIPRVLWAGKPKVSRGREIAVLLGQAKSWESATTATGFPMATCLYWGWGYPCVVIGMFLNGMLLFLAWKVFSPSINVNPISTLICVSLFVKGIRWCEGAFDGQAVYYVLVFAVFLPLSRMIAAKNRHVLQISATKPEEKQIYES
jgi:hypothetical protein